MKKSTLPLIALLVLSGCAQTADPETVDTSSPASEEQTSETQAPEATESATTEAVESEEPEMETQENAEADDTEVESTESESTESTEATSAATTPAAEPTSTESTESPSPTPTPTSTETVAQKITLAEVAQRSTQEECWVAIDGSVYDLTAWIRQHPGGRAAILSLCGTDGTAAFLSQHGGASRPSMTLDDYYLAPLAG